MRSVFNKTLLEIAKKDRRILIDDLSEGDAYDEERKIIKESRQRTISLICDFITNRAV